jgi:hypothetical protein
LNIIVPITLALFGIYSIFLSQSKKKYQKFVESGGEKFASRASRHLKIAGIAGLISSALWLLLILIRL